MKKPFLLLLSFLLAVMALGQPDSAFVPVSYTFPNGVVSSSGFLRDGKPDGYWKAYYETGILKAEGNRVNFMLDGLWKFYNEEGKIASEINYSKGLKNGFRKTYLKDEIIEDYFENDVRERYAKTYFADGKIKRYIPFSGGLENGMAFEYNRDSLIILISEYRKGFLLSREYINRSDKNGLKQGVWKEFYSNGVVRQETMYLNGKRNGYVKKYDETGTLVSIEKYINDDPVTNAEELKEYEIRRDYYPSGQVRIEGSYYNGKADGLRREYSEDGTIVKGYIFSRGIMLSEGITDAFGKKQGPWKEYYESGELLASGNYKNGLRTGEWTFYHRNGKTEQKGFFGPKESPDGEWTYYYESGNLLKKELYVDGELDGEYVEYSDSGKVIVQGNYSEGFETGEWNYSIGDVLEKGTYRDGVQVDWWEQRAKSDGQLIFKGKFQDGIPEGKHSWYYPDGSKKMEGFFNNGLREGDWKYFNTDGSLSLIVTYRQGLEIKYNNVVIKPELEPTDY